MLSQRIDWTGVREITERSRRTPGHPMNPDTENTMPQTTTQRTAKHRLAVKERMARMEFGLSRVVSDCQLAIDILGNSPAQFDSIRKSFGIIRDRALETLNPTDPAKS